MAETVIQEQNKVTAGYTLKVPVEGVPYASQEATVFVPLTIEEGATDDDIEQLAASAMTRARRIVAESLGVAVESKFTEQAGTGLSVEQAELAIKDAFPGAAEEKKSSGGGQRRNGGGGGGQRRGGGKPKGNGGGGRKGPTKTNHGSVVVLNQIDEPLPDWLSDTFDALVEAGDADPADNEMWDNRRFSPDFGGNGSPNAPWFKTTDGEVVLDWGGDPVA